MTVVRTAPQGLTDQPAGWQVTFANVQAAVAAAGGGVVSAFIYVVCTDIP
jgi:hypothetical protein